MTLKNVIPINVLAGLAGVTMEHVRLHVAAGNKLEIETVTLATTVQVMDRKVVHVTQTAAEPGPSGATIVSAVKLAVVVPNSVVDTVKVDWLASIALAKKMSQNSAILKNVHNGPNGLLIPIVPRVAVKVSAFEHVPVKMVLAVEIVPVEITKLLSVC